eukprot:SAG11_NODE_11347_length_766_cov_8.410795_1_plen_169_part_00
MSAMTAALNPVPPLINGDKPPFEKQKLFRIAMMVIVSMAVILHLILMFKLTLTTSSGTAGTDGILGDTKKEYCVVSEVEEIGPTTHHGDGTIYDTQLYETKITVTSLSWKVKEALDAGCTLVGGLSGGDQAMMCSKTTCATNSKTTDGQDGRRGHDTTTTHHCDCGPF